MPVVVHSQDTKLTFQLCYDIRHGVRVAEGARQHDDDRFLFFSVWMKPHANTPFSVFFDPVSAFVLLSEQCADPGCKQRREGQRQDLLELLFPVIAKAVVPGAAFCLRDIVLEKPGLRDQNVIQPDDVKGFNAEKNYKEADQKLSEGEALLYPIPRKRSRRQSPAHRAPE